MEFGLGDKAEAFRAEVRAFIAEHVTQDRIDHCWRSGTVHDWALHRAMAERRWIAPHWPVEYGGDGRDVFEMVAMEEELRDAAVPADGRATTMLVVDTLRHVGTEEHKRRYIPSVLTGEALICLGYSEPDSGSDVASASTRAQRDGAEWIINGQKMFTTLAHESRFMFALTRTNLDVPKHKGLTMFIIAMDSPGVEVRPIKTLGGQLVNATFLTDVRVPDSARIGDVDRGWDVMTVGLTLERVVSPSVGGVYERVRRWMRSALLSDGRPVVELPAAREQLARMAIDAEVSKLLFHRSVWMASRGDLSGAEGSMAKLFSSETYNSSVSRLMDALGPDALLTSEAPTAPAHGELEHAYRYAQFTTIGGGVSEIQRSIIAERHLGLPRTRGR